MPPGGSMVPERGRSPAAARVPESRHLESECISMYVAAADGDRPCSVTNAARRVRRGSGLLVLRWRHDLRSDRGSAEQAERGRSPAAARPDKRGPSKFESTVLIR